MMNDDDEVGLPQKGLNIIIKDILPDLRIANESRELLNQCCVEFIKHISREAQRISSCDQRKTIYHDHIQKALLNLGFPSDYVQAANSVLDECKIAAEKRLKRKKSRLDKCGIPEEELYLMQQELIEKARKEEAEKIQKEQFLAYGYVQNMAQVYGAGTSNTPAINIVEQNINQLNNESQITSTNILPLNSNINNSMIQNNTVNTLTDKLDCINTKNNEYQVDKSLTADETPIMTSEMKAVLAANFIASIQSSVHEDDSEDFD